MKKPIESVSATCIICGKSSVFDSWEPKDFPCKRNSFYCRNCQSIARNRHIAKTILELFPTSPLSSTLKDFAKNANINILHTCASGAIHNYLMESKHYIVAEYYDSFKSGEIVNGIRCEDLTNTSFNDNIFDLIITEDVFEHISDPIKAAQEIRRILKPSGFCIQTIPVFFDKRESITRAKIENGKIVRIYPDEYHGDPNRPNGVLVFTDFGRDLVDKYLSVIGKTIVYESHKNILDESNYAIYNNWVYVSQKILA